MKKKFIASALLAAMLVSTTFAGCSGDGSSSTASTSGDSSTASSAASDEGDATGSTSPTGAAIPSEMTSLTVELFDRNNIPESQGTLEDNQWTNWIKEEMKKLNVDVTFVPVPRSEETTKLNVLMASGSAPDISYTYDHDLFAQYAMDGGLYDLGGLMDTYGKDIVDIFEEKGVLEYGKIEDTLYAIPAYRSNTAHYMAFIRKDWLDKLNLSAPTTKEELVEVLKAFKEMDSSIYPWGYFPSDPGDFSAHNAYLYDAMYSFFTHSEEELYTTPEVLRDGFKEFMQWLNMLYSEGLIDPEFATKTTKELRNTDIMNGKVGFFMEGAWVPYGADSPYRILADEGSDIEYIPIEVFENADGHYYKTNYPPTGLYLFVPKTAKSPEAAVTYLNWMADYDVAFTLKFGNEGEQYEMQDGIPVVIDATERQNTFGYIAGDINLLFNGYHPDTPEEIINYDYLNNAGENLVDFAIESNTLAVKDAVPQVQFNKEIEAEKTYGAELTNTYNEYWTKLITSTDFETDYAAFEKEIQSKGIEEIKAERTEYYNTYVKGE
ncbi:MAG: extracellular solute-binding protein [Candidatus Merdivicinus sp.]|jgi:putative aldouronate transport system substrate-binding protein